MRGCVSLRRHCCSRGGCSQRAISAGGLCRGGCCTCCCRAPRLAVNEARESVFILGTARAPKAIVVGVAILRKAALQMRDASHFEYSCCCGRGSAGRLRCSAFSDGRGGGGSVCDVYVSAFSDGRGGGGGFGDGGSSARRRLQHALCFGPIKLVRFFEALDALACAELTADAAIFLAKVVAAC